MVGKGWERYLGLKPELGSFKQWVLANNLPEVS